jgi:hypothetical protein
MATMGRVDLERWASAQRLRQLWVNLERWLRVGLEQWRRL